MSMGKSKKSNSNVKNYGYWLGIAGNVLIWISLLSYFIILPLYTQDGYTLAATNKYKCFMTISKYSAFILGGFSLLYFASWGMNSKEMRVYKPLKWIDISMLSFLGVIILSHLCSSYKKTGNTSDYWFYEGTLYGSSGWFMGMMTFLILICMYFLISRFFRYTNFIWIPIFAVATVIFLWGILNRYDIYPVEMTFSGPTYLSSLGNANWFAGFQTVITPILIGLLWAEENRYRKVLISILMLIADAMIILNGSDSAIFSFAITSFVLLLIASNDERKMFKFCEVICLFTLSGVLIFLYEKIFRLGRNYVSAMMNVFVMGVSPFILFAISILLYAYFSLCISGKAKYPEWFKKNLSKTILIAAGVVLVLYLGLGIVNTITGGKLPVIGKMGVFIFDGYWGSERGATWGCGILTFVDMSFAKKLIGAGPDAFFSALCDSERALALSQYHFENQRLTNAHNEIITLLVNYGLLGVGAFIAMCFFAIKEFITRSKDNPYMIGFALSMVGYLANNMFSFEQITNIPFFFLIIGMGGAAIAEDNRRKAL